MDIKRHFWTENQRGFQLEQNGKALSLLWIPWETLPPWVT